MNQVTEIDGGSNLFA